MKCTKCKFNSNGKCNFPRRIEIEAYKFGEDGSIIGCKYGRYEND